MTTERLLSPVTVRRWTGMVVVVAASLLVILLKTSWRDFKFDLAVHSVVDRLGFGWVVHLSFGVAWSFSGIRGSVVVVLGVRRNLHLCHHPWRGKLGSALREARCRRRGHRGSHLGNPESPE